MYLRPCILQRKATPLPPQNWSPLLYVYNQTQECLPHTLGMTSNYTKNQEKARQNRAYTLRLIRREAKIHGNQNTVYPKTAAKEAAQRVAAETLGGAGNAQTVWQDGDGD